MKLAKNYLFILTMVAAVAFVGCSNNDDDDSSMEIMVNGSVLFDDGDDFNGDVDGDFTGNGGSA